MHILKPKKEILISFLFIWLINWFGLKQVVNTLYPNLYWSLSNIESKYEYESLGYDCVYETKHTTFISKLLDFSNQN